MSDSTDREVLSVSTLNYRLRMSLERQFASVWVEGEVTGFKKYGSGHWYLTLKDSKSQLAAMVPRAVNLRLKFDLQDGMHVIARGRLSIYEQYGRHQLQIEAVEPKGIGAAELALRQLKVRLQAKGYFDRGRKRSLHPYPRRVAIVTSAKGAAIRDMLELFA
ncbi:MAG TPA: exodeoxyribonuclease VII large subunit, partial [Urbifossiella sp.]|nr:exodeoxyribonuclease VII large subunit [Urbifossiella sp.]